MGYEPGTGRGDERGAGRDAMPADRAVGADRAVRSAGRRPRTLGDELGFLASVFGVLAGAMGLLVALGSVPVALALGEFALLGWVLLGGVAAAALFSCGVLGLGRWDYYAEPAPA